MSDVGRRPHQVHEPAKRQLATTSAASSFPRARRSRSSTSTPRPRPPRHPGCPRARTRGCTSAPTATRALVYPVEWEEAGPTHWEVTLRCPNCEWTGTGIFEQDVVERFDEELDRGTEALVGDLKRLMQANMEDEIERFIAALAADADLPEDF